MTHRGRGKRGAMRAFNVRDFDTCICGDYKHQHKNGSGECRMPNDMTHGYQKCKSFRLTERASFIPDWAKNKLTARDRLASTNKGLGV